MNKIKIHSSVYLFNLFVLNFQRPSKKLILNFFYFLFKKKMFIVRAIRLLKDL